MQFDVYVNPVPQARRAFPYVAAVQSDLADTGRDRVVVFLAPRAGLPNILPGRLIPTVIVQTKDYALLIPSLTNLPAAELKHAVGNIAASRDAIFAALDYLFTGV